MPLWMGAIAVIGFAALLAVFTGLSTLIASWAARRFQCNFLLLFPFSWVVGEWCRSWVLTGFPWLDFGYTQVPAFLFSWAPIGGIYLVSFLTIALAVLLFHGINARSYRSPIAAAMVLLVSILISGVEWTEKDGKLITVGVVQANISIDEKWLETMRKQALDQYQSLTAELTTVDLVVWPETAIPYYANQTDERFWKAMVPKDVSVLAGILDHDGKNSYNSAVLNCAGNRAENQLYRKRHLVPFGEYQPLQFLFSWVFEYLSLPMSDFAKWEGLQPIQCGDSIRVGLSICYEDAFANEYRSHLGEANVLVNISEDAWFGDSLAPHQRKQFAQMRARELGRPMVRSANSGPSLFIDHHGQLLHSTPQFEVAIASRDVQPMTGHTPYMIIGNWIVWLALLVIFTPVGFGLLRKGR
ncbi:apolipoprotein N-acyltransferase [Arenicella sp. 4NH20-0111]